MKDHGARAMSRDLSLGFERPSPFCSKVFSRSEAPRRSVSGTRGGGASMEDGHEGQDLHPARDAWQPLLVTPAQAATMLGVCRTMIYYLARDGKLTPVRIGRATRYAVV